MAVAVVTTVAGQQEAPSIDDDKATGEDTTVQNYESAVDGDEGQLQSQHLGDGHNKT